ncbi:MAG: 4-hydroxybutyrate CoA-transferase [Bacteroidetes bacterium CG12_big_fil_rev_8_21_14_0_65_60_17]|nr:MAG: 4-hydroxybutyrate CoA-transferase [Bacteroidetes bacterium CG12_big_fil_rev_8_21_14_0_65_60_17]
MGKDWKKRYNAKVCTADRALEDLENGNRVFIGSGAGEPQSLVHAMVANRAVSDIEVIHIMTLGAAPYVEGEAASRFRHNAFFIGANVRKTVARGEADYTPVFLSEIPRLLRNRRMVVDVALIQVSEPDEHGYCSYGVATDIVKAAAESARMVIAEVNSNAPRALGDSFIHVSNIDRLVPCDDPLLEAPQGAPDDLSKAIARHITGLIPNGATLQLGIGAIPDAVLHFLTEHRDLGIHTEMFSDGIIPLIEKGVVTNSRKTLHAGKIVASFVLGSRKLYDFIDNNPMIEFRPSEYTNDPFVIARNDRMVAINSALEVDMTGQVCADSLGDMFFSGFGGQVDFVRGARRANEGKAIIALPSTAAGGTVSRIVPTLKPGAGVVTSRADVQYVVTEYGTAYLYGKTVRERALALIQIAHPKFRPWLMAEAKARRLVYRDQIEMPFSTPEYPVDLEQDIELEGGRTAVLRPIKPTDEPALREMFYSLSEDTIYHRFFSSLKSMPHERLQEFLRVDYKREMAMVATIGERQEESRMVGIGRYVLNPQTNMAEVALLVADDFQGRGLGTSMLEGLSQAAKSHGIAGFVADVMVENKAMLTLFHRAFKNVESSLTDNVYSLVMYFD